MPTAPRTILRSLAAVLSISIASAQAPILLNYHEVGVSTMLTHSPSTDTLDDHVLNLRENGFQLSSAGRFQDDLRRNGTRVGLLTFDDGRKSVIDNAYPVLQRHGVSATVFVIGDRIDEDGYLTRADLQYLHGQGWEIGNHTMSHAALTDLRPASIRREVQRTNELVRKIIGEKPACVAYPFGLHDAVVREIISELNDCAYTTAPHTADENTDRFAIPRPPLSGQDDRALLHGERGNSLVLTGVGLGMLSWPLPDDSPVGAPPSLWTPTAYRTLGDGRYKVNVGLDGARHELSVREGPWALHLLHGRGTLRSHAIGIARNTGAVTIAGTYVHGEGAGAGVSVDLGNRTEPWAYFTSSGGLRAGIRFVPVDYTSVSASWHVKLNRFSGEASVPVPWLRGEGYPLRVAVGVDHKPYVRVSFRAGGNSLALQADTAGTSSLKVDMRW